MMSQERLNKCPLCKSGLFLNHREVTDFSISKENFLLCKCTSCNLVFTNPRPDEKNIGKYYQSEDYISHQNKSTNIINLLYKWVRNLTIKQKVKWLNQYTVKKGSLLDIGSGTGFFLNAAKQNNWKTWGIEPNKTARKIASNKKLKIMETIKDIQKNKKFDAITLFHALEHIHDLRKTSKKIVAMLHDDGTIFIAVPNYDSYDAKKYGNYWAALDVPRHLYHFNQAMINSFAEQVGLHVVAIEPLKFDSYYVSLLSQEYLNPKSNKLTRMVNAFINGYRSNSWAKKNNNNYSSLLYILKKK